MTTTEAEALKGAEAAPAATAVTSPAKPTTSPKKPEKEEVSKKTYRKKVWEHLEKNRLANFPRPVFGRIPNFKGSDEAAAKLLELEEFKNARKIEVNPDKAQEAARMVVLESGKQLYVPVPRLKDGLLKHITVPEGSTRDTIKMAINRRGIENAGTTISVQDPVEIDLLVLGSVAVSDDGRRIGKGRGYADLEFAVLSEMKAVDDKTTIVTIVHDSQVFETLPDEMFQTYDVPVDYILTPTKIIKVQKPLPRPKEIIWKILSNRRLNLMPVLQALKEIDNNNGVDVSLKEVDTDNETYEPRKFYRYKRFQKRRPRSEGKTSESQGEEGKENNANASRPKKFYRRGYYHGTRSTANNVQENKQENGDSAPENAVRKAVRKSNNFRFRRNKPQIDFSLMVSNIEKNVRVRDLKNALSERGIKPNEITWRGYKGFCYLHYAKPAAPKATAAPSAEDEQPKPPMAVDNVIEILQNLKICPESEAGLNVKVVEPVSRIETTDVTAV